MSISENNGFNFSWYKPILTCTTKAIIRKLATFRFFLLVNDMSLYCRTFRGKALTVYLGMGDLMPGPGIKSMDVFALRISF